MICFLAKSFLSLFLVKFRLYFTILSIILKAKYDMKQFNFNVSAVLCNHDGGHMKKTLICLMVVFLGACQTVTYKVVFDTGFEQQIDPINVVYGEILELPEITREGYMFLGWFISSDANSPIYSLKEPVKSSFTLYAKWRKSSYRLIFDTQGGTEMLEQNVLYGESITKPEVPIKNGYDFVGWSDSQTSDTLYTFKTMPGHDLTLYAIWKEVNQDGSTPNNAIIMTIDTLYEVFIDLNQYVMFSFTVSESGTYTIESYGGFDTYVFVYQLMQTGSSIITWDDLFQINSEDDFGEGQNFKLTMQLHENYVYYFRVEMFFDDTDFGTVGFKIYK